MSKLPLYFDYAATTPVDPVVAEKMMGCLTQDGLFGNPASRSHKYGWQAEEAVDIANVIWEEINLKNLEENILPTRNRASLIAKKGSDHNINELWIRKI